MGPKEPGDAVNDLNQTECWYKGTREPYHPYDLKVEWWHIFAARLAFVLAFEVMQMFSNMLRNELAEYNLLHISMSLKYKIQMHVIL